jgi:hypothetical protein
MANELVKVEIPSYLAKIMADNPELMVINDEAVGGISSGQTYPQIKLKGTRFRIVDGETDTILKTTEIQVVIFRAKERPERVFYLGSFNPDEEKAPDCQSLNGICPAPGTPNPQNSVCDGCHNNVWGTGKNPDGTPSKGKACKERKLVVVAPYGPDGVTERSFGLSIPPASLTLFGNYVKQLKLHGAALPMVITTISFSEDSNFPMLTFKFDGVLSPSDIAKVMTMMHSPETLNIIEMPPAALPAPATIKEVPPETHHEAAPADPPPPPADPPKERKPRAKKGDAQTAFGGGEPAPEDPGEETGHTGNDAMPSTDDVRKALGLFGE